MPHPRIHLHATRAPHPGDPAWQLWSHAWTDHIPTLTGRHDLTVVVAPGAGGGAPACFYHRHRRIEVDAVHIGAPDVADPYRAGHKKTVPAAYGLLVHEAGHAVHSRWTPRIPRDTPPVVADVAQLLEESRAEYRQRDRRRRDRQWLRHAVTELIGLDDAPVDDPWHAGQLAALLLARVDGRVLTSKDVRGVRAAVATVLGRKRLRALRDIWRQAQQQVDDTDAQGMIALAWRWCRVLGIDPHQQPQTPIPDPGIFAGLLARALADWLAAQAGQTPADWLAAHLDARHGPPAGWSRREATPAERHAARRLAARLQQARLQPGDFT